MLVIWELEENWDFPVLELVILGAIFSILNQPIIFLDFDGRCRNLTSSIGIVSIFLIFNVGALFSRSFAGSFSKGEMRTLLSYPLKRSNVLAAKFLTNLLILFTVYATVFSLNIPLLALSPLEPMVYVSMMSILVQVIFLSTSATTLSLLIKNEVISVLTVILLFFGLESITGKDKYLSFSGRHELVFGYFEYLTRGIIPEVAFQEVVIALLFPLSLSMFLLVVSLLYFNYIMEID